MEPRGGTCYTAVKANLNKENDFFKVSPRGNREDKKLINVIKVSLQDDYFLTILKSKNIANSGGSEWG